jgi:hypothetical protein
MVYRRSTAQQEHSLLSPQSLTFHILQILHKKKNTYSSSFVSVYITRFIHKQFYYTPAASQPLHSDKSTRDTRTNVPSDSSKPGAHHDDRSATAADLRRVYHAVKLTDVSLYEQASVSVFNNYTPSM